MAKIGEIKAHHRLVAQALATGAKVRDVSEHFGIHETTISSWRSDDRFAALEADANQRIRERVEEETAGDFANLRRSAMLALGRILEDEEVFLDDKGPAQRVYKASAGAVVQASKVVLDRTDAVKSTIEHAVDVTTGGVTASLVDQILGGDDEDDDA